MSIRKGFVTWTAAGDRDHKLNWPAKSIQSLGLALMLDRVYHYQFARDAGSTMTCTLTPASDAYRGKNNYVTFRKAKHGSTSRMMEFQSKYLECEAMPAEECRVRRESDTGIIVIYMPDGIEPSATKHLVKPEKAPRAQEPADDAEGGIHAGLTDGANDMAQCQHEFLQDHHLMDQFAAYWRGRHRGSKPEEFQEALDLLNEEIY